jgi:endonuclease I
MKTRLLLLSLFIAGVCATWAQGPNGSGTYYQNANGKKGAALKTAMFRIINPHYNIGYDGLYEAYKKTDTRPDGYVRDWYSKTTNYRHVTDKAGSYNQEGDCYNREHSVPQSWFGSGVIKSDIVHVLPTDGYVNNRRSNFPFGEVANATYNSDGNYCRLGSCKTAGYSGTVFEPGDDIKGDLARIYFYMATCYESQAPSWGHSVFTGSTYQPFAQWTYDMLIRWAKQDPIDDVEIARNNAVYETQQNRNPFVDYPGLEDYIWGDMTDVAFSYDNYAGGGSGGETVTVAMPTFSPDAGTYYNSIMVELDCATEGADIYFTTDGADASEQSRAYMGPFEITTTSTVKAVAIKDGKRSAQAEATYTITDEPVIPGGGTPVDCDVVINNALFGSSANGTIAKSDDADLTGSQNGITFVYALGSGNQRYANATEIRLYNGNTLTISVAEGKLTALDFTIGSKTSPLSADTGSFSEFKWTGNASQVIITSSSNTALRNVKVSVSAPSGPSAIDNIQTNPLSGRRVIYNLSGQRVANPTHGIYIVDGKKVLIP